MSLRGQPGGVADNSVTTAKLVDGAVTPAKLSFTPGCVLIETQERATQGSIDFTGIPATYRHLQIVASLRGIQAVTEEVLRVRLNGDAGLNYNSEYGSVLNATYAGVGAGSADTAELGLITGGSASANRFATVVIWLPNYAEAIHKHLRAEIGSSRADAAGDQRASWGSAVWRNVATVNRIFLWTGSGGGTFEVLSAASLYGWN